MLTQLITFVGGLSIGGLLCWLFRALHGAWRKQVTIGSVSTQLSPAAERPLFPRWWAQWIRTALHKGALMCAPVLANSLYASIACAQTTLQHVDPVVFVALQMLLLFPVSVVLLWSARSRGSRECVRLGLLGGLLLGGGFVCFALSLRTIGMLPAAMLTALESIIASGIAWLVFRQKLSVYSCLAAVCAGGGALLFWWIAPSHWQTDLVALACGGLFTAYAFHVERHAIAQGMFRQHLLPFFGGVLASMGALALALALCFGHWETVQTMTDGDLGILLYSSLGAVLIPLMISTWLLRSVSAVTWAFLAILEPLSSLSFAYVLGSLSLGLLGWVGVSLMVLGMLLQAHVGRQQARKNQEGQRTLDLAPTEEPALATSSKIGKESTGSGY